VQHGVKAESTNKGTQNGCNNEHKIEIHRGVGSGRFVVRAVTASARGRTKCGRRRLSHGEREAGEMDGNGGESTHKVNNILRAEQY